MISNSHVAMVLGVVAVVMSCAKDDKLGRAETVANRDPEMESSVPSPAVGKIHEIDGMCSHPAGKLHGEPVRSFALDRTEVTLGQYNRCVDAGFCRVVSIEDASDGLIAAHSMTWFDAAAFCEWQDKQLPSWQEWQWALRGGDAALTFPWGEAPPTCSLAIIREGNCDFDWPTRVGSRPKGASRYGCFDMIGNVAEWLSSGEGYKREVVGEAYVSSPDVIEAQKRVWVPAWHLAAEIGFRCAKPLEAPRMPGASSSAPQIHQTSVLGESIDVPFVDMGNDGFAVMKYEVNVGQYEQCIALGACVKPQVPPPWSCNSDLPGRHDHPMNCVTPKQAEAFCAALGGAVPSEEQWELVAYEGKTRPWPWGHTLSSDNICNHAQVALDPFQLACDEAGTVPVGSRPLGASERGVHDLVGNVWEIVRTEHGYVRRGGGWSSYTDGKNGVVTLGNRAAISDAYIDSTGFRCVRNLTDTDPG